MRASVFWRHAIQPKSCAEGLKTAALAAPMIHEYREKGIESRRNRLKCLWAAPQTAPLASSPLLRGNLPFFRR
jgi:hypothetical protein